MKSSLLNDKKALARFCERINSDPKFQPHLRKNEPDWGSEVAKLNLTPGMKEELVSSLKLLWVLPFADVPVVRELFLSDTWNSLIFTQNIEKQRTQQG